jgi:hypothetical protein
MLGQACGRGLGWMQYLHNQSFCPDPDTVIRTIAGETILVPIRNNIGDLSSIFVLNEIGTFVWSMIEQCITFEEMLNSVIRDYDVSDQEAGVDLVEFLNDLENAGLIRSVKE